MATRVFNKYCKETSIISKLLGKYKMNLNNSIRSQRVIQEDRKVQLKLSISPSPSEIFWPNLYVSLKMKIVSRSVTYFISSLIIGISLGILFLLKLYQKRIMQQIKNEDGLFAKKSLTLDFLFCLTALSVFLINYCIATSLKKLTMNEKLCTSSDFFQALLVKISLVDIIDI